MARGGGTGPRNKKKRSDGVATTNGPTTAAAANGPTDTDTKQFAETKTNSKPVKNRQKKEETPPSNHIEEDGREEVKVSAKLQPTSEQLRLAQITQGIDSTLDPQRKGKIGQVMDITGKSEDEVATALFDCGWDETKAIELLLEEGGGFGSWEETGKKKKKKQENIATRDEIVRENEDWDTENYDPTQQRHTQDGENNHDRSRNRGPPRFKRGGAAGPPNAGGRGDRDDQQWKHRELQENERNFSEGRGRGGGAGRGGRARGGGVSGGSGMPPRQRGRGGGPRQFSGPDRGGGVGAGVGVGAGGGLGVGGGGAPDSGPFGQMDTWNPVGEESSGGAAPNAGSRRGKISSRDAFDNAGNWGDDFPAAEDWDNDEYTGSLSDTKVFTPSGAAAGVIAKSAVGDPVIGHHIAAVQQPGTSSTGGANNSLSGAAYSQPMDLSSILQQKQPAIGSAAPGGPTSAAAAAVLNHQQYNQVATQDLKSAIGIGGSSTGGGGPGSNKTAAVSDLGTGYVSSSINYASGNVGSQFSTAVSGSSAFGSAGAPGSAFSPIKPAAVTNGTPGSKALPRARLPPPSKIPASAVEMPGDSLANLDVQFGGLDLQFGAAGSDAGLGGSSGFDFGGSNAIGSSVSSGSSTVKSAAPGLVVGSSSAKPTDLESKFSSIPAPASTDKSLDSSSSFKSLQQQQQSSIKDVNQSLSNALSAAGIKPSGGSDSSLAGGYAQRSDKSATSSYQQRSPGPQPPQQQQVLDHRNKQADSLGSGGGYPGNNYSYQSGASAGSKASSQYGGGSGYQSSGYERQSSTSGYSSSNGLAGSGYGGGGYNSNSAANSSQYSSSGYNSSSYNASASSSSSNYSPYNNSNSANSYSSSSKASSVGNSSSGGSVGYASTAHSTQQQQFSTSDTTTTTASSGKFEGTSVSNSGSGSNNSGYAVSSSGGSYGLGANSSRSAGAGGIAAAGTGTNKMLPNLPPGVTANVIPQYMIGAGAGAGGFPAYLTGLQQPMYGYTGVGASQLEDLAALQRSTLASLPQLVGTSSQLASAKATSAYYDPSSQFGSGSSLNSSRQESASSYSDSSKFGQSTDSTSSPVPSTVAAQPTPFNALASTFAAAGPTQLPPGYAYFYGGMAPQLQAAYGGTGVYPAAHPGLAVPTASGATATTQFPKGYASSYNNYDSLPLGQNSSDYGKSSYGSQGNQAKGSNSNSGAAQWYSGGTGGTGLW